MIPKHRLLIVDDHAVLRAGLCALLAATPDLEVVGEADNGRDAVRAVAVLHPEVVLTDIAMPGMNGFEATIDIKRRFPRTKVLVLTVHCGFRGT